MGISAQYEGWTIPEAAKIEKSPLKPSPEVAKKGKSLFGSNCQKCHGPEGKGNGPDADPKAKPADLTAMKMDINPDGVIYYKIWNGHPPAMPAHKSKFTKENTWTLVEYVKSLLKRP
jgi:mono/diheme cytochrome c family protein